MNSWIDHGEGSFLTNFNCRKAFGVSINLNYKNNILEAEYSLLQNTDISLPKILYIFLIKTSTSKPLHQKIISPSDKH